MHRQSRASCGWAIFLMLILTGQSAVAATLLSKAQQDVIAAQIAELRSNEEREMASSWSDAKKVAEFICRPLALQELRKWKKEADRVFLGTDDPSTLEMTSSQTLTGSGQVRVGSDWDDFTFTCRLDPDTGKALSFEVSH